MRVAAYALLRASSMLVALPVLVVAATPANAGTHQVTDLAAARGAGIPFGFLGPVGLAAIAFGLLGMIAGTVRQRRRARAHDDGTSNTEGSGGAQQPTSPAVSPAEPGN